MQGERRADGAVIQQEYGVSRRLAARLVALLSRQVDVTPTLIEIAQPGTAAEKLLLHGDWMRDPATLTSERIGEVSSELAVPDDIALCVEHKPDGWRTLGIEDDLLADQARPAPDEAGPEGPEATAQDTGMGLMKAADGAGMLAEASRLFSPDEIARLKLAALTSQNAEERVEAMRKLVFTPLSVGDKAGVYVNVLIDRLCPPHVRAEASHCLEQLGFRADLADAIRDLYVPDDATVQLAVERISALLQEVERGEAAVTLTVIIELFDQGAAVSKLRKLLALFEQNANLLVQSSCRMKRFVQAALKHLSINFREIHNAAEDALTALARHAPEEMAALLWEELGRTEAPQVRGFLLALTDQLSVKQDKLDTLARKIVDEILNPALGESQRARLRFAIGRLRNAAVSAILLRLPDAKPVQKPELIRLLDVVCTEGELSEENFHRAVGVMLDQLKVADRQTRRTVLETRVPADPRVKPESKRKLAAEFLAHLHEFRLADTHESIRLMMLSIGTESVDALFTFIKRSFPNEDADEVLKTLGQVIVENGHTIPEDQLADVAEFCIRAFERDDVARGGFVIALADLCGFSPFGREKFDEVLRIMFRCLWKTPYTFSILDALGIMAGSPNAEESQQKQLTTLFCKIVNMEPPDEVGVRKQTDEGTVYEFGREIDFDTVVVPTVVRGLQRIVSSEQASFEVRETIVKQLLILWEGVSNMRVVWSPGGTEALIQAMSTAAQCLLVPVDVRVRLGRSLLQFVTRPTVTKSLGDICAQADRSGQMEVFCLEAADRLLAEWQACEQQDDERKSLLLTSLAKIASNTTLDARKEAVQRVRDEVMQAVFQGLRESIPEVVEPLTLLRDCPALAEQQREEIRERMLKAFGLAKRR